MWRGLRCVLLKVKKAPCLPAAPFMAGMCRPTVSVRQSLPCTDSQIAHVPAATLLNLRWRNRCSVLFLNCRSHSEAHYCGTTAMGTTSQLQPRAQGWGKACKYSTDHSTADILPGLPAHQSAGDNQPTLPCSSIAPKQKLHDQMGKAKMLTLLRFSRWHGHFGLLPFSNCYT